MTFADEILKPASKRHTLARIEPGKYINDDLVSIGGNLYTISLPGFIISRLKRSDSIYNLVVSTPAFDNEYSFDESTGLLTIYSLVPPSASAVFVVYFYLFYTTDFDRYYPEDAVSGIANRLWKGRILESPNNRQDITNIASSSILTSSQSKLSIDNTDFEISNLIDDTVSFKDKSVIVWLVVNGQIEEIFKGLIKAITSITDRAVDFSINDFITTLLNNPAYIGDYSVAIANKTTWPSLRNEHVGKPIPFIYGQYSPYGLTANEFLFAGSPASYRSFLKPDTKTTLTGIDIGSNEWILCRIPVGATIKVKTIPDTTFAGVVSRYFYSRNRDVVDIGYQRFNDTPFPSNFLVGDSWSQDSIDYPGTTRYFIANGYSRAGGTNFGWIGNIEDLEAIDTPRTYIPSPYIVVRKGGKTYVPYPELHYTSSLVAAGDGISQFVKITFTSAFFTDIADEDTSQVMPFEELDNPRRDPDGAPAKNDRVITGLLASLDDAEVFFRVELEESSIDINHADVLQNIIENAGLSLNAASFTAAKAALSVDTQFCIPNIGESSYQPYAKYIQDLIQSTLGTVYLNTNREVVYKLFDAPDVSASNQIIEVDTLGSPSVSIDYFDVVSKLTFTNDHVVKNLLISETSEVFLEDTISQYLHETKNEKIIKHVLADITPRYNAIANLKSKRFLTYRIETSTINLLDELTDTINLQHKIIMGGLGSKNLVLLGYEKSQDSVKLIFSDLYGL